MKLYIDDIRDAPDESWTLVRTITEAIRCIAFFSEDITEISLDHDISAEVRVNGVYRPFPTEETFQPVVYYIAERYRTADMPPKITIHSANPIGAEAIEVILSKRDYPGTIEIKPMGEAHRKK